MTLKPRVVCERRKIGAHFCNFDHNFIVIESREPSCRMLSVSAHSASELSASD